MMVLSRCLTIAIAAALLAACSTALPIPGGGTLPPSRPQPQPSPAQGFSLIRLLDPASASQMMVRDIEFDSAGNIFIAGGAFSGKFPTTPGAYDRSFARGGASTGRAGASDAFVMKFNRAGDLLWSTLIGGPNYDRAYGLEVAPDGGVVIAGRAGDGFPTTAGVVQPAFAGDVDRGGHYGEQDGFIAKLSADGSTLLWSTYFGEDRSGAIRDVAIGAENRIYVAGWFHGGLRHITSNALQPAVNGARDLVYARLSADASRVEYATYLGGSEGPSGQVTPSIIVAPNGDVYLATDEGGSGAPTTPGAYQRKKAGGDDFLIARFNAADRLLYATYLGGSGNEDLETHNIAVDAAGRLAIAAVTASGDYPTTSGAYQTRFGGGRDGVVSILSADGSRLEASTFFGGGGREDIQGVEFAPSGLLYVSGGVANGSKAAGGPPEDAFLVGFSADLTRAPSLSHIGGSGADISRALAVALDGALAAGGQTASPDFPASGAAPFKGETSWWALITP